MIERAESGEVSAIDRYRVIGRLAKGGMAEVLLGALDGAAGISRAVVIKRVLPHLAEETEFRAMFLDEARIVAGLRHQNIVSVLELGESDGSLYLVMEYLQGEGLDDLSAKVLHNGTSLEPRLAAFIVAEACAGLHAAHTHTDPSGEAMRIIHRDVSPHNIFLSYDGHVKLIDFGIAQSNVRDSKTQTGIVKGKISYMAPEQLDRRPLDHRVDVFALGIVLWELLTGERLFRRDSPMETVRAVCFDPIPGPLDVREDVPVYLDGICRCALSRDPEHRYETAAAMREDLLQCIRTLDQSGNEREELARLLKAEFAENLAKKKEMIRAIESGNDADVATKDATRSLSSRSGARQVSAGSGSGRRESSVPMASAPAAPTAAPRPAWPKQVIAFALVTVATVLFALVLAGDPPALVVKTPEPVVVVPEATPAPTPAEVILVLNSSPVGATVSIDGAARGETPLELEVPRGDEPITLTFALEGYVEASREVVPDSALRMEVALSRSAARVPGTSMVRTPSMSTMVRTPHMSATPRMTDTTLPSMSTMRIFRVD